jgi:Rap1a immunity proteins
MTTVLGIDQGFQRRDFNAEPRIQAAIVKWVVAPGVLMFAVPNGGLRSKAEAARMKWTGVVVGIPDLVVIAPIRRVFFLEVKTASGRLSEDRRAIFDLLVALGAPRAIVRPSTTSGAPFSSGESKHGRRALSDRAFRAPGARRKEWAQGRCSLGADTCDRLLGLPDLARHLSNRYGATTNQTVRVVVKYIDDRLARQNENFTDLTLKALQAAWPCQHYTAKRRLPASSDDFIAAKNKHR